MTLSAPLKSANGQLLSDRESVVTRRQEYFSTVLNRSSLPPPDALLSEARASTPDPRIGSSPPTIMETHKAINYMKAGKAPDHVASIQNTSSMVEVMQCMHSLHEIIVRVWRMKLLQRNGTKA